MNEAKKYHSDPMADPVRRWLCRLDTGISNVHARRHVRIMVVTESSD